MKAYIRGLEMAAKEKADKGEDIEELVREIGMLRNKWW